MTAKGLVISLMLIVSGAALAQGAPDPDVTFGKELLAMRDPFRRPEIASGDTVPISELEIHPLHAYSLVGVMTGPKRLRGMVRGPDGKTYFVSESDKIGNKRGFIKTITPSGIVVQEFVVNVLGEEETTLTDLKVPGAENK